MGEELIIQTIIKYKDNNILDSTVIFPKDSPKEMVDDFIDANTSKHKSIVDFAVKNKKGFACEKETIRLKKV